MKSESESVGRRAGLLMLVVILAAGGAGEALAHCDTLEGPVVKAAREALDKNDLRPVLVWVREDQEQELAAVFQQVLAVRGKGPEARRLADMYFFETVVRLHRAAEGQPYTGLKPRGAVEPVVVAADEAFARGNADKVLRMVEAEVRRGIRARFAEAMAAKKESGRTIEAGRAWLQAYITFTHYVEALHALARGGGEHLRQAERPTHSH